MAVLEPLAGREAATPLRAELQRALRAERRRCVAWLAAALVVTGVLLAVGLKEVAIVTGAFGVCFAGWSARLAAGLKITLRNLGESGHPPRRAVVLLLRDPNPRAIRPLLAVWPDAPPAGERLPKAESVWRCDDELLALESDHGDATLHEAWVDTGSHGWSTIRWVCADAGPAVPHRRAILGRLYLRVLLRAARPGTPEPLTVPDPHTVPDTGQDLPLEGAFARSLGWRIVALAALAGIVALLG